MRLYRYSSGLVIDENFNSLGPDWSSTDPANTTIENGSLKLLHSTIRDVTVLRDVPADANAFEATVNYTPTVEGDQGGLTLFNAANRKVELLEMADAALTPLDNIKVVRNGDAYDFYMERGGVFEFIDTVKYNFLKIGFVLKKGNSSGYVPFYADRFIATKNDCLQVKNLLSGHSIELTSGTVVLSALAGTSGTVELALPHLIMNGTLRLYDDQGVLIGEQTADFVGGDVYYYGTFLEIRKNGVSLSESDPNELGRIQGGVLEAKLELYNPTASPVTNIVMKVEQYLGQFGSEWADIAPDNAGVPGTYADILNIPTIDGVQTVPFWVRIQQNTAITNIDSVFFSIHLEHD
ncbi:hypothetical protein BTO30_13420 [Domibacillus antri]|uniref:Virion structural protein n=1 Tax=Domibacillus antri TaxID=1714264 RepID=A0A1Q8Q2Y3_9BACI|nr:hypothetical protein [Domibacillus antri]OLN21697.1 hypothetical protein BTO30_13420 [Domibacillus antri]